MGNQLTNFVFEKLFLIEGLIDRKKHKNGEEIRHYKIIQETGKFYSNSCDTEIQSDNNRASRVDLEDALDVTTEEMNNDFE